MAKDPLIAVRDCLAEIEVLGEIATSLTRERFEHDAIARRAAAYGIQTISEAVRHIPAEWLAEFPNQPWAQIRAIGNRIRHEYFKLDDAMLWKIITTDMLSLKTVLTTMLARRRGERQS